MKNVYKVLPICLIVLGLVCPGCRPSSTTQLEENKAIARRWVDEANKGSLATFIELLAPDFVYHGTGTGVPRKPMTREELEQGSRNFFAAFPGARLTIEDTIAEGDRVVMRWTVRATHKGEFAGLPGLPATGKEVTVTSIIILRIADGKIVEVWNEMDELGMMQQVGAIPAGV